MSHRASSVQKVVRSLPLAGSLVGMVLILGSIALFFDSDSGKVVGATAGILALLGAVWYAANPFLKNTRRYFRLRSEAVGFTRLVSQLNAAVTQGLPAEEIERAQGAPA